MRYESRFRRGDASNRALRVEKLEQRALLAITVNTLVDEADGSITDGDVSLRDAVANAAPGETIDFAVTGTINLQFGQIPIFQDIEIRGPGSGLLIVDAAAGDLTPGVMDGKGTQIFSINDFQLGNLLSVRISGMTLKHADSKILGGAIYNRENLRIHDVAFIENYSQESGGGLFSEEQSLLTLTASVFRSNTGVSGGGLASSATATRISDSTFELNGASQRGGALSIANNPTAAIIERATISNNMSVKGGGIYIHFGTNEPMVIDSTISDNQSEEGGGIYSVIDNLLIDHTLFAGNRATRFDGGGLYSAGATTIVDSTFIENYAEVGGGGLFRKGDYSLAVTNSTFSQNTAGSRGGAIHASSSQTLAISSSTIWGNTAGSASGGVHAVDVPSTDSINAVVTNSIIANNRIGPTQPSDMFGTIQLAYSLLSSVAGAYIIGPGNILGVNPNLGPLANNGSGIPTHLPLTGSPAINAGDPAVQAGSGGTPLFDQRGVGYFRVSGGRIDMGAVETNAANPDFNGDLKVSGSDFLAWQRGYGSTSPTLAQGDANHDGNVDGDDLSIWTAAFGASAQPAPVAAGINLTAHQLADIAAFWESLQDSDD